MTNQKERIDAKELERMAQEVLNTPIRVIEKIIDVRTIQPMPPGMKETIKIFEGLHGIAPETSDDESMESGACLQTCIFCEKTLSHENADSSEDAENCSSSPQSQKRALRQKRSLWKAS